MTVLQKCALLGADAGHDGRKIGCYRRRSKDLLCSASSKMPPGKPKNAMVGNRSDEATAADDARQGVKSDGCSHMVIKAVELLVTAF